MLNRSVHRPLLSTLLAIATLACGSADPGASGEVDIETHADAKSTSQGDVAPGGSDAGSTGDSAGGCAADLDCPAVGACRVSRCVQGTCKAVDLESGACSDGDPCTWGDTCQGGACVAGAQVCECHVAADCAPKDDGDLCNGVLTCDTSHLPYRCVVAPKSVVHCDPAKDTQCTQARCDPTSGKCAQVARVDGTPCSDGDPCSVESACVDGSCVASKATLCGCKTSADCASLEDGDVCNGQLFCDKSVFPFSCKVNPATVITCPSGKDTSCSKNTCDPKSGSCAMMAVADGTPCDDGSAKTVGDLCVEGVCKSGTDISACKSTADCVDDGDLCNGVPYCDVATAKCKTNPATLITCATSGDTACVKNTCVPSTGACAPKNVLNGTACDDGDKCTTGEICLQGACGGGKDTCGCASDAGCVDKDDGNLCNGTLFCDKSKGVCKLDPTTIIVCKSGADTQCIKNACVAKTGACAATHIERARPMPCGGEATPGAAPCRWEVRAPSEPDGPATACDDGDKCTTGATCGKGKCAGGTFTCACASDADCDAQDDGDKCNGVMFCNKAKTPAVCQHNPATVVSCKSVNDTACLKNTCHGPTGKCLMKPALDGTPCSDGNDCTKADYCSDASCKSGSNTCECQTAADCVSKDDGDKCNGTMYCDTSGDAPKCKPNPASVVVCPTGADTACLKAKCEPQSGSCKPTPVKDGTACDDGDACSKADLCLGGKCVAGQSKGCDDGNPCTLDTCDAKGGCVHPAATGLCDKDGDACTKDFCKFSSCLAGPKLDCDDGNVCTIDSCDKKKGGCSFEPKPKGSLCSDGNLCTSDDACQNGTCVGGLPAPDGTSCKQGTVCRANVCDMAVPKGKVAIPAGDFWMGCNPHNATKDLPCQKDELPYRKVWTSALFMDRLQVTVADYGKCVAAGGCTPPKCEQGDELNHWGKQGKEGHPVNCVAAAQAAQYCAWADQGGRLPSEAEWEKAARGGCEVYPGQDCAKSARLFPWGQQLPGKGLVNVAQHQGPAAAVYGGMSPYGVVQLVGNGLQWVSDTYSAVAYATQPSVTPLNQTSGASRSARGSLMGSTYGKHHRLARRHAKAASASYDAGVRCVLPMACEPGKDGHCDDGNPCTTDTCSGVNGCTHKPKAGSCDLDGQACSPDQCVGGRCIAKPSPCDDKDPCTKDICVDGGKSCKHEPMDKGAPCDDGDVCTEQDGCVAGKCKGTPLVCSGVQEVCVAGKCKGPPEPMLLIPAGTFYMGCNAALDTQCQSYEKPQHLVELSSYYIDKHEVSVERYELCVAAGKCAKPNAGSSNCNYGKSKLSKHPMNCVSWAEARDYCEAMIPNGRLPTEAEWERAARGGCELHKDKDCAKSMPTYPWGEASPACPLATIRVGGSDICGTGEYLTAPVGAVSKSTTPYGAMDMIGNVKEWTADKYDPGFYAKSPKKDPLNEPPKSGWFTASVRGGGVKTSPAWWRASARASESGPGTRTGFRCARDAL